MGTTSEEPPKVASTDDPVMLGKLCKQIDYYFSESNLPRDKFLRAKVEEDPDGYVELKVLNSFNRIKAMGVSTETMVKAVQGSEVVEVNEGKDKVRRIKPLPEVFEWKNRAIRVKGWIPDGKEPTIEEVEAMFEPYGKVLSVKIRRWRDETDNSKHFKGSLFVEFENEEAAERAVAETHTITVEEKDDKGETKKVEKELDVLSIEAWKEAKSNENKERKEKFRQKLEEKNKKEGKTGGDKEAKKEKETPKKEFTPGLILKIDGIGPEVSREDLKEILGVYGTVAWVDFDRGNAEGHVRFGDEGAAAKVVEAFKSETLRLGGNVPEGHVLEGEEEETYWKNLWEKKESKRRGTKRRHDGGGGARKKSRRSRADRKPRDNDRNAEAKKADDTFEEDKGGEILPVRVPDFQGDEKPKEEGTTGKKSEGASTGNTVPEQGATAKE